VKSKVVIEEISMMIGSDYLKCGCFFTIGALSTVFDVAAANHVSVIDLNWVQIGAPLFILSSLKGGTIALLAYLMKSPVPIAGLPAALKTNEPAKIGEPLKLEAPVHVEEMRE
jgi:hypothetical protein